MCERTVLLTGATGFVGGAVYPALEAAGFRVRCGARDVARARARWPEREWVACDLDDARTLRGALEGCWGALYLVHGIGVGPDYPRLEEARARRFVEAGEGAGVARCVYLGGVAPVQAGSRHLASRLKTGEVLRAGGWSAVELRAGMVVGWGSASWAIVRKLAGRLPVMLLPSWLERRSWPVGIEDVVRALVGSLEAEVEGARCWELPGAEGVTHRQLIRRVAEALGKRPWMVGVPVVTPRLSSYWITAVTGVEWRLVAELVEGIQVDLEPQGETVWDGLGLDPPESLGVTIQRALRAEQEAG